MKGPGALGPTKPPRMSGAGGPGPHLPPRMSGAGGPRPHLPPRVRRLCPRPSFQITGCRDGLPIHGFNHD